LLLQHYLGIGVFVLAICLYFVWLPKLGMLRAGLAVGCRILWLVPLLSLIFPKTISEALPSVISQGPLHVLVDDSSSVMQSARKKALLEGYLEEVRGACQVSGCSLRLSYLSELSTRTRLGVTPMSEAIQGWAYQLADDPWMVFTDGGDEYPTLPWPVSLRQLAGSDASLARGVVVGLREEEQNNFWVAKVAGPTLSFQDQTLRVQISVSRSGSTLGDARVQLQVDSGDVVLASKNTEFMPGDRELDVEMVIPPLARGPHLLRVHVLPVGGERDVWDNTRYLAIDVMPNTVGALHLLGAPSIDGRFMRRFLKGEPKFDLISFFILRDPWDVQQQVNERELSLIPFPVKRLFEDELSNFRVVVFQNFTLHQFLEPAFQENLVQYVLNGGSMLFLGGPRALTMGDINSTSLAKILPFHTDSGAGISAEGKSSSFEAGARYRLEMADPPESQRHLASVFDDWQQLSPSLTRISPLQGIHRLDQVKFKDDSSTPLLMARMEQGPALPLAVASYPGKGRVIWLFTDAIWQLATDEKIPRQIYDRFLQSAMTWLMRDEVRRPLSADRLDLRLNADDVLRWSVHLQGPAAKFFTTSWDVKLCQRSLGTNMRIDRIHAADIQLSGELPVDQEIRQKKICSLEILGQHPAFGSVRLQTSQVIPRAYSDAEVSGSDQRIDDLITLTRSHRLEAKESKSLSAWVASHFALGQDLAVPQFRTWTDYYWLFHSLWIYFFLLFLPLEVLFRRWEELFGR
jgi:hypothetical protein